eukprot:g1219.t1
MASAKAQAEALRVNMHYDKIFDWQKAKVGCDVQWMKGEAPDVTTTAQPKEEPASAMKSKERRLKPKTKLPAMTVDDMKKQVPLHVAPQVHQRNILKRFPGEHAKRKPPPNIKLGERVARANKLYDRQGDPDAVMAVQVRGKANAESALDRSKKRAAQVEKSKQKKLSVSGWLEGGKPSGGKLSKELFKPYRGDQFGTRSDYSEGFMYRSRIAPRTETRRMSVAEMMEQERLRGDGEQEGGFDASDASEDEASEDENTNEAPSAQRSSQRCAATLRNWSYEDSNLAQMVDEGVIEALVDLTAADDRKTSAYTATVYRNLTSRRDLAWRVLECGGTEQLCKLAVTRSATAEKDAVLALLNLSELSNADDDAPPGSGSTEERMVDEGVCQALAAVLQNKTPGLARPCVETLHNLTCVQEPYHRLDRVAKMVVQLASSGSGEVKLQLSKSLLNLSNMGRGGIRSRLLEEGVINACTSLSRTPNVDVRLHVAAALSNIASSDELIIDLVEKNVMMTLKSVAEWPPGSVEEENTNAEAQHWCASAINKLLSERTMCSRMVSQAVVKVLIGISAGFADMRPKVRTCQLLASCFQQLAMASLAVQKRVVEDGLVRCVSDMLASSSDSTVKQRCTIALCNLLSVKTPESSGSVSAQGNIKLQVNVMNALIRLAEDTDEDSRSTCALALYNFSCMSDTRQMAVRQGVIFAVNNLSRSSNPDTRNLCAACFSNLSAEHANPKFMVEQEAVQATVHLLSQATEAKPAALEELETDMGTLDAEYVDQSTVDELIRQEELNLQKYKRKLEKDPLCREEHKVDEAKALLKRLRVIRNAFGANSCIRDCVDTLCHLSEHGERNRQKLVEQNAIPAVIGALNGGGSHTINGICVVMANITYTVASGENLDFGTKLMNRGMGKKILELATLTDFGSGEVSQDVVVDIRRRCTTAICNLTCNPMVREGLVEEGVVPVLNALCNTYLNSAILECARSFCNLSCNDGLEQRIVAEGAMPAILMIGMVRSVTMEAKRTCAQALLNLLVPDTLQQMVEGGLIQVLASLLTVADPETSRTCARLFRHLTMSDAGRKAIASEQGPLLTVFRKLKSWYTEAQLDTGSGMCNLLMSAETQSLAVHSGALEKLRDFSSKERREPPSLAEIGRIVKPHDVAEVHEPATIIMKRYDAAVGDIIEREGLASLQRVRDFVSSPPPADLEQPTEQLDTRSIEYLKLLMDQASNCQEKLRRKIAPDTDSWGDESAPATKDTASWCGGAARDPGVATERDLTDAAAEMFDGHYHKIHDAARMDLIFDKCDQLLKCVEALQKEFDVRGVINNFQKHLYGTLGWCDMQVVCVETLDDGSEYICTIRLFHEDLANAREDSVGEYTNLRNAIMRVGDSFARRIVDAALHRRAAFDKLMGADRLAAHAQDRKLDWSEQVSKALFTVSCTAELRVPIVQGGALPLLVVLAQNGNQQTVRNCVDALVNMAWDDTTRTKLVEAGAMDALLKLTTMSDDPFILYGIARVFCYLAFHSPNLLPMVNSGVVAAFMQICKKLPSIRDAKQGEGGDEDHFWELGQIICLTIRLLSEATDGGQKKMVDDGVVELLCIMTASFDRDGDGDVDESDMAHETDIQRALDCAATFCKIAQVPANRTKLVHDGGLEAVIMLAKSPCADTRWRCAAALRYMAIVHANRFTMVSHDCTPALMGIAKDPEAAEDALIHCAHALHSLAKSARGRSHMASQGVVPVLLDMSQHTTHVPTKQNCAAALAYLSNASSTIEKGAIRSLIQMNKEAREQAASQQTVSADDDDSRPPPPLPERKVAAPPTTQIPEIQVREDNVSKYFVGGGGPPPAPVEAVEHAPLFFSGKVQGEDDKETFMQSMAGQMSALQTAANSPFVSPRGSAHGSAHEPGQSELTQEGSWSRPSHANHPEKGEVAKLVAEATGAQAPPANGAELKANGARAAEPAKATKKRDKALPPVRASRSSKIAATSQSAGDAQPGIFPLWGGPAQPVSAINVWGSEVFAGLDSRTPGSMESVPQPGVEPGSFGWQAAQLGLWNG